MDIIANGAPAGSDRRGRRRWLSVPLPRLLRLPRLGFGPRVTRPRKASFASTTATLALTDCVVSSGSGALSVSAGSGTAAATAASAAGAAPAAAAGAAAAAKAAAKPASDVIAGALARAASQSTIHPLDTLKVRLQASSLVGGSGAAAISKFGRLVPPAGAATGGAAAGQLRALGASMGSLYKGVVGAASGAGIAIGTYFAFYGWASNAVAAHTDLQPGAVAFVAGAVAAAGSSVVKVPLAVCIRSVQAGVYPNVFAAASAITAAAGPRGLFTGYWPTLLEDVPDMAFKFATYESLRGLHRQFVGGRDASPGEDFAMGAVAGAAAAAATTPLDVVKTRMMCSAASRPTMMAAARGVLAQGGAAAFFTGVGTRALSNGINSAVFFCFFEAIRGCFKERAALQQAAACVPRPLLDAAGEGAAALPESDRVGELVELVRRPASLVASATPLHLEQGSKLIMTVAHSGLLSEDA